MAHHKHCVIYLGAQILQPLCSSYDPRPINRVTQENKFFCFMTTVKYLKHDDTKCLFCTNLEIMVILEVIKKSLCR